MPTPRPGSDRLRLELDILASELDGDEIPLEGAPLPSGAPPDVPTDDGLDDPEPADDDLPAHMC